MQEVRVVSKEFVFEPAQVRFKSDRPVHLVIVNEGREAHEFHSTLLANPLVKTLAAAKPAEYREADILKIPSGKTAELTLLVPAGSYVFYCKIKGHSGMSGTITAE